MNLNKSIQMALTVFVTSGVLFSCNPGNNAAGPNGTTTPDNNATGEVVAATVKADVSTQSTTAVDLQSALVAVHDDEATFSDAGTVADDEGGFATKQLREGALTPAQKAKAALAKAALDKATPNQGKPGLKRAVRRKVVMKKVRKVKLTKKRASVKQARRVLPKKANFRAELKARAFVHATVAKKLKKHLQMNGAVTVNEDGTFTVDPKKAKANAKDKLMKRSAKFKENKTKFKAKLEKRKEVAKEKLGKLRRKNQIARSSDVEEITNEDGTVTKIRSIQFENSRTTIKRDITISRTFSADGKLMTAEYTLEAKSKNHEKSASRLVTFNDDGSKTITYESMTKWTNGNMREVHFERVVDAEGNSTGGGSITMTKDGVEKVHTMNMATSSSGEVVTSASDADSDTEVVVEESAEGDATVTVAEEGEEEATEEVVDVEDAAAEEEAGETGGEETVEETVEAVEEVPAEDGEGEAEAA